MPLLPFKRKKKSSDNKLIRRNRKNVLSLLRRSQKTNATKAIRSKKKSNRSGRSQRMKKKLWSRIKKYLLYVILLALGVGLIFVAVRSVLDIKGRSNNQGSDMIIMTSDEDVLGIDGVPSYPGAVFMFRRNVKTDLVQDFLSKGRSAYIMPTDAEWDDVKKYYSRELVDLGWTHELSIDFGDEKMMDGEYYTFEPDSGVGQGLRIYTKFNDIWYETITVSEAKSGLADRFAQEKELEMIIEMSSGDSLPDSYPWALDFPKKWSYEIRKSDLLDIELVEFTSSDSDGSLVIEPVDFSSLEGLKTIGVSFVEEINTHRDSEDKFEIVSDSEIEVADQDGVFFELRSSTGEGRLCVTTNPNNGVVYAILTLNGEIGFFNYVLDNLEITGD
ncbi:hypothetical protein JW710_00705 [Candidatus Dojkabacteria bacterium]|nr:hypothetical protein [Candidatus Dojkabacteria bacterium]